MGGDGGLIGIDEEEQSDVEEQNPSKMNFNSQLAGKVDSDLKNEMLL